MLFLFLFSSFYPDEKTKFEVIDINRIKVDYIDRTYKKIDPLTSSAYIICINSLQRLAELTKDHKNKYVVFIDEITSFIIFREKIENKETPRSTDHC